MTNKADNSQVMNLVFQQELTDQGLKDLREKYPANLVVNMQDDEEFKKARKVRTERNKLTESIDRRRKDVTGEIKEKGDSLIEQVNDIYSVIVEPFEAEDKRRKEEVARIKAEREAALNAERQQISEMNGFITQCQGKDSGYIAEAIEAIDLVETDVFDKELIHEAIETKKQVLATLTQMHADAKAREKVEQEREALRLEQESQQRINGIQMSPMNCFGKSSDEIAASLEQLQSMELSDQDFGAKLPLAEQAKQQAITQLQTMKQQAEQMEQNQSAQAEQQSAPAEEEKHTSPLLNTGRIAALEDDEAPYECADWSGNRNQPAPSAKVSTPLEYTPLALWPSDANRADNDELDRICHQLEEAEAFIEFLKAQRAAA